MVLIPKTKNLSELIFICCLFLFSYWLMWHTFDYKDSNILIATKAWSDFGANIPLIRSFSKGNNFPPEYPLFPGEPIRYHFLFYLLVGMIEKMGTPISWALNVPSVLGFWGLIVGIYFLTKLVFKSRTVSFLAVIFFLFNGSFSFLEFFKIHPLSLQTISEIISNTTFPSFGPYDGKIVSAFWNLNIYTNQRHLAIGYLIIVLFLFVLLKSMKKTQPISLFQTLFWGIILGLTPIFHKVVFFAAYIILFFLFLSFSKLRKTIVKILIISTILAIPQIIYYGSGSTGNFSFRTGYLVPPPLTTINFFLYWFKNLGLSFFLIPLGFVVSDKNAKKILLAIFPLFIIGNLFQFSPEIAANHKFFNLFLIFGNMYSAYFIILLWQKNLLGKLITPFLIFFMVLSGIIDLFPIKNDFMLTISDAPNNQDVEWILKNTPPDSIFLNSSYLYHPASLAGRKIFIGWPYFTWGIGYDADKRGRIFRQIYESKNKTQTCFLLRQNHINYFTVENTNNDINLPNIDVNYFKQNFDASYSNPQRLFLIYNVELNCQYE